MNPELFKVERGAAAGDVLDRLLELDVSACPVVREDGRLLGVVTLKRLAQADADRDVAGLAGAPGMTVPEDKNVREIAELMADTGEHHVVVVTATGRVVGIVSTIDVVRELCEMPPRWPDPFPHFDARHEVHWSNQRPLDFHRVQAAPSGPGVFSLLCKSSAVDDHVVWSEYASNLRERLMDMLAEPTAEIPAICSVLSSSDLRFRVALVENTEHARTVVDSLQRMSGYGVDR